MLAHGDEGGQTLMREALDASEYRWSGPYVEVAAAAAYDPHDHRHAQLVLEGSEQTLGHISE